MTAGEYRGLIHRNNADLKTWLARRPTEAALEPDLPIIDPHHHLWDTPQRGLYFLPELGPTSAAATTSCPPCSSNASRCSGKAGRRRCAPSARSSS
jgi:hypothetical protein